MVDPDNPVPEVLRVNVLARLPEKEVAVIVPALKLPEPSRATIVLIVLAEVALDVTVKVAAPDPLYVVDPERPVPEVFKVRVFKLFPRVIPEIVDAASLDTDIEAEALISALTITPAAIEVAVPLEVISPVKLGIFVVVDAVPVKLPTKVVAVATPETLNCGVLTVVSVTFIPPAASLTPNGT